MQLGKSRKARLFKSIWCIPLTYAWKTGQSFTAGDVLLEIETDKAQMDVEAQDDGVMAKIMVCDLRKENVTSLMDSFSSRMARKELKSGQE